MGMKKRIERVSVGILFICLLTISACRGADFHSTKSIERKTYKFGATYMQMNNPYFQDMNAHLEELVEVNGDVLICRDPSQDQEKQNQQIEEMIAEGVDGIFLNPVNYETVKPALLACKEAGIPVFCIDTKVYDEQYVAFCVLSDNYDAGVQCAKDMMKKKDSAKIVILDSPRTYSIQQRVQGFEDTIAGNDNYQVVTKEVGNGELEVSMEKMNQIIATGQEFDVALGGNDPTALGILAALQMNQMQDDGVLIYGIDGSPDGKLMINEGYFEGSSAQKPLEMAEIAVDMAYDYLEGKKTDRLVIVPVTLITLDNIDEFDMAGWQ